MAYEIKRTNRRIEDEVRLTDGDKELLLTVSLGVDDVARQLPDLQRALLQAQKGLQEAQEPEALGEAHEALRKAIRQLLELIFGTLGMDRIQDFYDDDLLEALTDFAPYITEVIVPHVTEAQREMADKYRRASW